MEYNFDTSNVIRANEWHNKKAGTTTVRAYRNPTRKELIEEAKAAFSNSNTERLHNVIRTRDNITGTTMEITGLNRHPHEQYYMSNQVHTNKSFLKKLHELFDMKPKEFMHEMLTPYKNIAEDISGMGRTKWAEWTGELTRYSDSVGSTLVKNKVPKETTLRKVLSVFRRG